MSPSSWVQTLMFDFSPLCKFPEKATEEMFVKSDKYGFREGKSYAKAITLDKRGALGFWGSVAFFYFFELVLRPRAVGRGRARFRSELDVIKA